MTRPRIRDVAQHAGVSPTTVSLVLNDRREGVRIPEETRQRVRRVAADLGYAPNSLARGLRTRRSHTIGLISDEIATTPYAVSMIEGAESAAWQRGYLLILVDTGGNAVMEATAIKALQQRQVDGLIYACMYHRVVPAPRGIPRNTVFLDAEPAGGGHPAVVPDERSGARTAVRELLDHGHRRIAFLDDELHPPAARLRHDGYREALAEHGMRPDPALHLTGHPSAAGGLTLGRLLDLPAGQRPTAVFCFNDRMAMGAYRALRLRGLRIPADVSVVGYDDQLYIASELDPPLTTMALPHREMARWAVQTLLDCVEGVTGPVGTAPVDSDATVLMPCPLVRRESVGPPPG